MAWIRVHVGLFKKKKKTLDIYIIELAEICDTDINAINNEDFCINHELVEYKNSRSKVSPPSHRRLLE